MEVVVAVFTSSKAAVAAIEDLESARVPSATVRQFSSREDFKSGNHRVATPDPDAWRKDYRCDR